MLNELIDDNMFSLFIDDSIEYLEKIPPALIKLENGEVSKESIDEIFRAVHSIKGGAGILEFHRLTNIVHTYESILDKIRSGKIVISKNIIDFLFDGSDWIYSMIEKIKQTKSDITIEEFENITEITEDEFAKLSEKILNEPVTKIKKKTEKKPVEMKGTKITITFKKDEVMKKARFLIIYNEISEVCKINATVPDFNEIMDDSIEEIGNEATFYVDTDNYDKIEVCMSKANLEGYNIAEDNKKMEKIDDNKHEETVQKVKEYMKVEKEKLDLLFNIVGELFIKKSIYNQLKEKMEEIQMEMIANGDNNYQLASIIDSFGILNKTQERQLNDLQKISNSLRMVPIKESFSKFVVAVRKLTEELNKKISFEIYGEDTEVDKMIAEKLSDPLLHMVRNSVDHGIEDEDEREEKGKNPTGRIMIKAYNSGNNVVIRVEDDGRGINVEKVAASAFKKGIITKAELDLMSYEEKLNLIFMPGFSTAETVTSISGRGVGMDVVKKNIESIKGKIEIDTKVGRGTAFTIRLPLTLAIIRALLIRTGNAIYAFPSDTVVTVEKAELSRLEYINGRKVIKLRNKVIPIISLREKFKITGEFDGDGFERMVIISDNEELFAVTVDSFIGQQFIVIKDIEGNYHKNKEILGAAVLGDGNIALVIDINSFIDNEKNRDFN